MQRGHDTVICIWLRLVPRPVGLTQKMAETWLERPLNSPNCAVQAWLTLELLTARPGSSWHTEVTQPGGDTGCCAGLVSCHLLLWVGQDNQGRGGEPHKLHLLVYPARASPGCP